MKKLVASLLALGAATTAQALPVQWSVSSGGNGHFYDFIGSSVSWTDARAAALASTNSGKSGYLATITSAGENAFLGTLAGDGWIGATDQAVEGEWRWADGPEGGQLFWQGLASGGPVGGAYSSWNGGEPNNSGGENYAHYQGGHWNDLPNSSNRGYFVEFGGGVPEPAAWAMTIGGFGLLGAASRRRRSTAVFA